MQIWSKLLELKNKLRYDLDEGQSASYSFGKCKIGLNAGLVMVGKMAAPSGFPSKI